MHTLHYIVIVYLGIGCYLAGRMDDDHVWYKRLLMITVYVLAGGIILIISVLQDLVRWVESHLQLRGFWRFYIRKGFRNEEHEWLGTANKVANLHTGVRGIMWRFLIKRINKVNNYNSCTKH